MAKLFVSYSRRDSPAARKLIEAFKSIEQDVWVDWEAIPPAVDWLEQIFRGIEEADAFIFLVSPDSIASEVCKVEINRAAQNNKRIIPIVLRDVHPKDTPEAIGKLNWTFLRETDDFEEGLAKIKTAIELDLDWLEEHRRLQVRALEWHRRKDSSLLLRGRDLHNAQRMVQTYTSKDPVPTELQVKYIDHSRRTERNRTFAVIATVIAVVVMAVLSYTAYQESRRANRNFLIANQNAEIANRHAETARQNERKARRAQIQAETEREKALEQERIAREQERIAEAQRSAARAQIYQTRTGELYTSTLLALDSWEKSPSDEAEEILRKNISLLPLPVAQASLVGGTHILESNPAGETFLSASDGMLCVRNIVNGREVFCRSDSGSPITDALFVQAGESIAVAYQSGLVRVLDAYSGDLEREIAAGSAVRDLDVTPDGQTLAIARENGNITILGIDEPVSSADNLFLSGGRLAVINFSPNGQWIAAGSQRGNAAVWNLITGRVISTVPHRAEILSLKFSPNSRFLISAGADNYAVGHDIQTDSQIFRLLHSDRVTDIAFPPGDSTRFVTASDDSRVRVWELETARERMIMFQDGPISDVAISSDGKWISATGEDETVRVWNAYSGVERVQIPLKTFGMRLGFSNDNRLLVSGDANGRLGIWDISEITAPTGYVEFVTPTLFSAFSPSGERLVASDGRRVWLLNSRDLSRLGVSAPANAAFEFKNPIRDLVFSPGSQTIAVSTDASEVIIQDLQTRIPLRVDSTGTNTALAYSADGALLITGSSDGIVETWEVKTGSQVSTMSLDQPIFSLAASPAWVAVGLLDRIVLLDPNADQKTGEMQSSGENRFLAFNADGSMLVSVNTSGQIQVWETTDSTFEPITTVRKEAPYSIALHPQGSLLAVATVNYVYMIDPASGREISRIPHRADVFDVSFSADGETLATASMKAVQVWDVSELQEIQTADLLELACSRLIENFSPSQWIALFGSDQPYEKMCDQLPEGE